MIKGYETTRKVQAIDQWIKENNSQYMHTKENDIERNHQIRTKSKNTAKYEGGKRIFFLKKNTSSKEQKNHIQTRRREYALADEAEHAMEGCRMLC